MKIEFCKSRKFYPLKKYMHLFNFFFLMRSLLCNKRSHGNRHFIYMSYSFYMSPKKNPKYLIPTYLSIKLLNVKC
jgi:hypothetical protein